MEKDLNGPGDRRPLEVGPRGRRLELNVCSSSVLLFVETQRFLVGGG